MTRFGAVLVGVDQSAAASDPLRFAAKDAADWAEHFASPAGGAYDPKDVWLLRNAEATRAAVFQALALVPARCELLIFGFSGHGSAEGIALRDHAVLYQELAQWLRMTKPKRTLVLVDACACGAAGFLKRAALLEGLDLRKLRAAHAQAVFDSEPGMRALVSCEASEESREGLTCRNGEFTGALLSACRQELGDRRGIISAEAAFEFARL